MRDRCTVRTARRRAATVAGALVLSTGLAACGGDGSGSGAEVASLGTDGETDDSTGSTDSASDAPTDPEEAMLAYAECMRDHGIDMPDPTFEEGGGVAIEATGKAPEMKKFEKADTACQPLMENVKRDVDIDPEQQAEMREQMLDYAECMRGEGIDMPDPKFGDGGDTVIIAGPVDGGSVGGPAGGGDDDDDGNGGAEDEAKSTPDNPREFTVDPNFEKADEKCVEEVGMEVGKPGGPMLSSRSDEGDD